MRSRSLGETTNAPKSNSKFDGRAQSVRRSTAVLEDPPSPSSRGCSLPSQFDILMPDSGYEFYKVESSATAVKTPVVTRFDQSNCAKISKPGAITKFQARLPRKEFAPSRRRPIMTSSPTMQQVMSVGMTDKKCVYGLSQHCNCSTKPFGYVNTSARAKVALPRSNLYPDARRIAMNQSGGCIYYQVARTSFNQSQQSIHTATDQSEASNPGSFCYKRRCRDQFVSSVVSNSTAASRNTLSSIRYRGHFSNRTLQFDVSLQVNH